MGCGCQRELLETVAGEAGRAGVFGEVRREGDRLVCRARDAEAEYRLDRDERGRLWVSLVTADRWLSESIETELLHSGDKIEELLEDELIDLGAEGRAPRVEHYRSDDLLFTFRSPVPVEGCGDAGVAMIAARYLLAYEACFRQLGDMGGGDDD